MDSNPAMTQPVNDLTAALQNTSMLAAIRIKRLGLGRTDKDAAREVAQKHNAQSNATRLVVNRLAGADHYHQQISTLQNTARTEFNNLTLAWDEEGWRLLPNENFPKVLNALQPILEQTKTVKDEMIANVQEIIAAAAKGIGTLSVQPPTEEEILNAYDMKLEFQPLPDGSRFKGLPPATMAALSRHIEARARGAWEQAQSDATGRVAKALGHLVNRLTLYQDRVNRQAQGEEVPRREGVFTESVVDNVKELAELLPAFNVAGDPRLAQLSNQLSALAGSVTTDVLRADQSERERVMAQARDMLDVLAVWKGGKP